MTTYTPPTGLTPQGQATGNLADVLSQISGMAANSGQDPTAAVQNAFQTSTNAAQPQAVQQATQSLTQQAGIPQLQGQQQNLGQVFQLWLADQNLSQKYSSSTLQSPNSPVFNNPNLTPQQGIYTGTPSKVPNPYLADPSALVNAVTQPSGQGFQGFTTPGQNTSAIGAVPNTATGISNILGGLISNEQGLVNSNVNNYETQYGNIMNTLGSILGNQSANAFSQAQPNTLGSKANAGATLSSIIDNVQAAKAGQGTEYDLFQYLNSHQQLLKDQGVDMNTVWNEFHSMFGANKNQLLTGGKTKIPASATTTYQLKKLPDGTMANYDKNTGKFFDPNTGKQLNMTGDQLQAAEDNAKTAQSMMDAFKNMNPVLRAATWIPGATDTLSHLDPNYATAQSKLFQSLGSLRRGAIGGRITQQEITWLTQKLFPAPQDSDATMQAKVNSLKDSISKFQSDPNAHINPDGSVSGGSGGSTGSGVNRQSVVNKLKQAGYNDNDIHAYLKQKGIDG